MLFKSHLKGKEAVIFEKRLVTEDPMTLQEIGDIDLLQESMIDI